jgi:hypothetical protein
MVCLRRHAEVWLRGDGMVLRCTIYVGTGCVLEPVIHCSQPLMQRALTNDKIVIYGVCGLISFMRDHSQVIFPTTFSRRGPLAGGFLWRGFCPLASNSTMPYVTRWFDLCRHAGVIPTEYVSTTYPALAYHLTHGGAFLSGLNSKCTCGLGYS